MEDTERARADLLTMLAVGDTVRTILRHVSRSGMTRDISLIITRDGEPVDITYLVSAAMGRRLSWRSGSAVIRVGGAGMDMGFHLVYSLSRTLWPDGHYCTGAPKCPSNDHANDYGDLTRRYDAAHDQPGADTSREEWFAYEQARREWIASRRTYRRNRHHPNGGYALRHRWL